MGSFTPWGALCCVIGSCWGTFTSVLIIASPTSGLKPSSSFVSLAARLKPCPDYESNPTCELLNDRHQFGWLDCRTSSRFRFFPHVRNLDAFQHCFDALIHFAQRLTDVAAIALTALPANRNARCDEQRAVDGLNHFESGNCVRG